MTSKEIFNQYFKRKLIFWVGIGVIAVAIRLMGGHQTSLLFLLIMLIFFVLIPLTIGYIDYRFYEKTSPKIISQLLDKEPLLSFQNIDFVKEEDNRLKGTINNYQVILSPFENPDNKKFLTILIPLQIREGLDNYFTRYNDNFRLSFTGGVVFAQAILEDYDTRFNYDRISNILEETTVSLYENKIEPLTTADE